MESQQSALDLPLITEATNEFYRQVYANNDLGHIFKGVNMVVLRRHVSYFILQLTAFETPMTEPQTDYLRKVHGPVIEERGATQRHFDILVSLLISSLRNSGAQGTAMLMVQKKLRPLRDIFPMHAAASACGSQAGSSLNSVDGTIVLQEGSSREQHAHHSNHKQQQRCPGQSQQPRTADGAAPMLQQEASAQQQQQRVPCSGQQQVHCCQRDKQASPKQQQLQATSAASAPVAIRATQQQQQQQYPAPEQHAQQPPACCVMAKQVAPEGQQQQQQVAPAASTTPVQLKLDAEQQQLKLQQQQQGKEDSLPECVPQQPWWKCLVFCT